MLGYDITLVNNIVYYDCECCNVMNDDWYDSSYVDNDGVGVMTDGRLFRILATGTRNEHVMSTDRSTCSPYKRLWTSSFWLSLEDGFNCICFDTDVSGDSWTSQMIGYIKCSSLVNDINNVIIIQEVEQISVSVSVEQSTMPAFVSVYVTITTGCP